MAIIRDLKHQGAPKESQHTDAEASFSIVSQPDGEKVLQIDTYGSEARKFPGKKSQSIRFAPAALRQLKQILKDHFPD